MSNIVIKVEHLSKMYRLGIINNGTLWKDLQTWIALKSGREDPHSRIGEDKYSGDDDHFWALKDIDFEIQQGDRVGIIGKNGAGKSTLLKILSRITAPTEGTIRIKGKIASLLEVGTGFNGELTGRENVYLNGAILGMKKRQIDRKLEEIIAFSGIEHHMDTPVKRYSSGMFVRLGFAVAAHLDSDILIADEVLAVGDDEFQKKALGKMENLSKGEGRTVLFVSHNMGSVKKLCEKGILLRDGRIERSGGIAELIDTYVNPIASTEPFHPFLIEEIGVEVLNITLNESTAGAILPSGPLKIDLKMKANQEVRDIGIEIMISHEDTSGIVFVTNTKTRKNLDVVLKKGENKVSCLIDHVSLCSGRYWLGFGVDKAFVKWYYYNLSLLEFNISESMIEQSILPTLPAYGHVYLDHTWLIND
jgi:ABC-type polysaccharide/polyol phosphate transport system ATPase subunit